MEQNPAATRRRGCEQSFLFGAKTKQGCDLQLQVAQENCEYNYSSTSNTENCDE